ncbi:hypothetical protein O0L34_g3622 [Tuta absoluta]|nr:hypothetical protein O0L34_g3622 [Tuta absoluta]
MAGLSTYLDLYRKLRIHGDLKDFNFLHQVIVSEIPYKVSKEDLDIIKEFCRSFTLRLSNRWKDAGRSERTLLKRDTDCKWLESSILWPTCSTINLDFVMECGGASEIHPDSISSICTVDADTSMETKTTIEASTSTNVEKRKAFEDLSNKQKKRRSSSIVDAHTEAELLFFLISKLKDDGKHSLAKVIKTLYESPQHEAEVTKVIFTKQKPIILSEDKSLAICTSLSLSKWKYLTLRSFLKEEELVAALPSYAKLLAAKKRCYPSEESIEITERGARIRLQDLLDHTVKRILLDFGPVTSTSNEGLKMVWKWGLDGSSSQSNYKQRWTQDASEYNESCVVMTSIVPLRLIDGNTLIIWENPAPCSTYYGRPIKFTFSSETADFIKAEESNMNQEIAELIPTTCDNVEIGHELHMTMIDGKVVTSLADVQSHSTCPICLATPSQMNKLDILA